jgi:hypothetical protein
VLYQKLKEILKIHNFNTYLIKKYFLKITYTTTVNTHLDGQNCTLCDHHQIIYQQ